MSTVKETLVVDSLTQFGFRSAGKNYSAGKYLNEKNFPVGKTIVADVYTGPKGGKSVNKWEAVPVQTVEPHTGVASAIHLMAPPPVPSLPKTSVAPKADEKGVSPVAPAKRFNENGATGTDDRMSKADWQNKDKNISIDAIHKSTLESPALGNMVTGKSQREVFELTKEFLKFNLDLNQQAKRGEL